MVAKIFEHPFDLGSYFISYILSLLRSDLFFKYKP
jgi:hypothetical protein